jgi:hypothetical protein
MAGSPWLVHSIAAAMLVIAGYGLARLVAAWRWHRLTEPVVDAVHVAMGLGLAGLTVPRLDPLPAGLWVVVFGLAAAWFAGQAGRDLGRRDVAAAGRRLPHLLGCAAMLYMYSARPSLQAMPGMARPDLPVVGVVLALALLGYIWQSATRLAGITDLVPAPSSGAGLAPRLEACCELLIAFAMAYALIAIL